MFEKKGELVELDLIAPAIIVPQGELEVFYSMLAHYAHSRGYKVNWIAINFFHRFGYYPSLKTRHLAKAPPDRVTLGWSQAQLRDYARRANG